MSGEAQRIEERNNVGVKLIAGEEAEAAAATVVASHPEAVIEHYPAYISIEVPNRMTFEMERIAEQLGRPYDTPTFLVILSSYNGRINVEDNRITLSSELG
jgi:hypothetical protein